MYYITDTDHLEDPELQIYTKLSETQLYHCREPHKGLFIAESPKVIERALNAGYKPVSMLMDRQQMKGEGAEILERIGTLEGDPLPVRICIMEEVVNPTNVGAIFRSAAALGMDAVLLTHGCADPLYRRAVRVSMGTVFQIPWTFLGDRRAPGWPQPGIDKLRGLGFKTAAMALKKDSVSISDPGLLAEPRLAVILGTEGDGLAEETIAACDYTVMIPMFHGVDSLNVAAASAVAFWELRNRR